MKKVCILLCISLLLSMFAGCTSVKEKAVYIKDDLIKSDDQKAFEETMAKLPLLERVEIAIEGTDYKVFDYGEDKEYTYNANEGYPESAEEFFHIDEFVIISNSDDPDTYGNRMLAFMSFSSIGAGVTFYSFIAFLLNVVVYAYTMSPEEEKEFLERDQSLLDALPAVGAAGKALLPTTAIKGIVEIDGVPTDFCIIGTHDKNIVVFGFGDCHEKEYEDIIKSAGIRYGPLKYTKTLDEEDMRNIRGDLDDIVEED